MCGDGSMVGNLTLGKKKYESVQEDIKSILEKADALQNILFTLVEEDADGPSSVSCDAVVACKLAASRLI